MFTNVLFAAGSGDLVTLLIPILLLVAMYFIAIRPQKKQEKQVAEMRNNLQIGDEISTNGGILGRVVKIKDDIITIETGSDKNKLKIFRWAVRAVEIPADAEENEE
jgi:preprotein translocase subunit YajC